MNKLIIGANKQPILTDLPNQYLFIDDCTLIDQLDLSEERGVEIFDPLVSTFNPLRNMNYRRARDFVDVLNAVFPEGDNTLTKARSTFQLLSALTEPHRSLQSLIPDTKETADAYQKIQTLFLSPVLSRVLVKRTTVSFKKTVIARLDRATLGDFDCFVLGNLLVSQYTGTVVIPDFSFYAVPSHIQLIRQERLIAGINSFDDLPDMRSQLLLIQHRQPSGCTPEDAAILAVYQGLIPHTNEYNDFIHHCVRLTA